MKAKKQVADLGEKVRRYLKAHEAGKRGYERADRLMKEIAANAKPGDEISLNETGKKAVLVDNFAAAADKGIIWNPCAARRWKLEIIEP
jgi:hypothetical protein